MASDLALHYLQPTAMSPLLTDRRQLNTTAPGGAVDTATGIQYALNGTGIRQLRPGTAPASNTASATIPATNATPANEWGWRLPADLFPLNDRAATVAGTWNATVSFVIGGATTGPVATVTGILYLVSDSVDTTYTEVGRGSVATGLNYAGAMLTIPVAAGARPGPANSRFELHVYVNVTTAAVSLGATTWAIRLNSTDSKLDPGVVSLVADRTASETVPRPADTPQRDVTYVRRPTESVLGVADTPRRAAVYVRLPSETVPRPVDTPSRQTTFPRSPSEAMPVPVDAPHRVLSYTRVPTQAVSSPADTPARSLVYARTVTGAVALPVDAPRRVAAYARRTLETVPVPADSPGRQTTFRRSPIETISAPVDAPSRLATYTRVAAEVVPPVADTPSKLTVYGRNVSHAFAETAACPPCPPGTPPALILVDGQPALRVGGKLYQRA